MVIYCPVVIGPLIVSKHTIRTQFRTVMHNCRSLLTIIFSTFSLPLHTDLGIGARLSFRPPPKVVDESIAIPFPPLPPMSVPWCSSVDESKTDEVSQPTVDESIAIPFPPLPPMSVPWCSSVDESKTDEVSQPTTAHIRRLIESQQSKPKTKPVNPATLLPHAKRCGCGCIPQIPTLFEMAELRRQYKLRLMEEESDIAKEAY
ncbi:MAG: hypothetical protein ACI8RD_004120 [Bacillariaceae sp.]|jgi:hypothetical protein